MQCYFIEWASRWNCGQIEIRQIHEAVNHGVKIIIFQMLTREEVLLAELAS